MKKWWISPFVPLFVVVAFFGSCLGSCFYLNHKIKVEYRRWEASLTAEDLQKMEEMKNQLQKVEKGDIVQFKDEARVGDSNLATVCMPPDKGDIFTIRLAFPPGPRILIPANAGWSEKEFLWSISDVHHKRTSPTYCSVAERLLEQM